MSSDLPWHQKKVISELGDFAGKSVLDIACGSGDGIKYFLGLGAHVAGIDISERAVEVCRAALPKAQVHVGVAEILPFDCDTYDVVTCFGSLEHFLDQPKALHEMHRVLKKPDGRALFLVPNADFLTRKLGLYGGTNQSGVRETVYSIDQWKSLFEEAGFKVVHMYRDLRPVSKAWINQGTMLTKILRGVQALALTVWPTRWQYQVYFQCKLSKSKFRGGDYNVKIHFAFCIVWDRE